MSKHSIETFICPKCGKEMHFTLWQSVNTVLNPEMIEQVKTGKVFNHICEHCGENVTIVSPLLYHMMDKETMVYYVEENEVENAYNMFRGDNSIIKKMNEHFNAETRKQIHRIVTSPGRLIEKITIFEDGLDDRVIEVLKLVAATNLEETNPDVNFDAMFYDVSDEGEKRMLLFYEGHPLGSFTIGDMYAEFAEIAKEWPPIEEDDIIIDSNWAIKRITNKED